MAHCIECGTGLPRRAIYCPACAARRLSDLYGNTPGDVNPASFSVMEPEMLIAPVRLATARMTGGDSSPRRPAADGARSGLALTVFIILGSLAMVITIVFIANALATSG